MARELVIDVRAMVISNGWFFYRRTRNDDRLRGVVRDVADFERVLRRRIMTLPGAGDIEANVLPSEERRPALMLWTRARTAFDPEWTG